MQADVHPVDEILPASRLVLLGLQNVMVMYANAVAAPLIVGAALHLPKDQLAILINADLFVGGVATVIQSLGIWKFGIRLPIIMGVTAVAITPLSSIAVMPGVGMSGLYGSIILAGVFGLLIAPITSRLIRFFPPVVTGTIITMIGLALIRVGILWSGGEKGASDFGSPASLAIAIFVLCTALAIIKFGKGIMANSAVLLSVVAGYLVTTILGWTDFSGLAHEKWVTFVLPLRFGLPSFPIIPAVTMCLVMTIVFVEATGMFLALGTMTGRVIAPDDIKRGLRADALATILGGLFNTFPYVSYSQNIGLIGFTGVISRWVCVAAGIIMMVLGTFPKCAFIVASIPKPVIGGASFIMFGMVAATGIRILAAVDFVSNYRAPLIIAVSLGLGLVPMVAPDLLRSLPTSLHLIIGDSIILTALAALSLNILLGGSTPSTKLVG